MAVETSQDTDRGFAAERRGDLAEPRQPGDLSSMVLHDQALTLYDHARGGLAMSAIVSLLLALMVATPGNLGRTIGWFFVMAVVLGVRTFDLLVLYPARRRTAARAGPLARDEIRRYAAGVGAAALVWIAFPPLFFPTMTETSRAGSAVILAAMAGGSPIMLGAVLSVAIGYCLALILPFSVLLLLLPGRVNLTLGTLGLTDAVVMTAACRVLHRRVLAYIRLTRSYQVLTEDALLQQSRTQAAQIALREANQSLEARVEDRTADLRREILERRTYARALERLTTIDALTGLLNRSTLSARLAERMVSEGLAVLFLDVDGFKHINDAQGHDAGDHVLRVVAARLAAACEGDEVARWGGDEFVIVTTRHRDEANAIDHAGAILASLTEPIEPDPSMPGARAVRAGVSIGIALAPAHGSSPDELIRAADTAMYATKQAGGGRVTVFTPSLARASRERRLLEQSLRRAPADGSLALHYQPIVNALSGHCDAMEALLRWTHPTLGAIGPALFIPVAERSEQIIDIGRFVLHEACGAAMRWPGRDPPAVSVNISIAQIVSGDLLGDVQDALAASGLPSLRLQLEITETMFVGDVMRIMPVLETLRGRGIHLSLDDFGTGFSSLARLATLPIDTIKIDKMFVQAQGEQGLAMLRAMLLIARAMRLDVTAEGVETPAQMTTMTALGATRLQGFLLARPMPAESVAEWLASGPSHLPDAPDRAF